MNCLLIYYKNLTAYIAIAAILLLLLVQSLFIYSYLFRRKGAKSQLLKKEYQKEIQRAHQEIQEQTLIKVSKELHDNVGHILSVININLAIILSNSQNEIKGKVAETKDLAKQLITDLRNITTNLNSEYITNIGLNKAIEIDLTRIKRTSFFETNIGIVGDQFRLESKKEIIVYRIFQESLNNIIKHSKARKIFVFLNYTNSTFSFEISDDGVGFDYKSSKAKGYDGSSGIQNMINRANIIDANLVIYSQPDKGTTISIRLLK